MRLNGVRLLGQKGRTPPSHLRLFSCLQLPMLPRIPLLPMILDSRHPPA